MHEAPLVTIAGPSQPATQVTNKDVSAGSLSIADGPAEFLLDDQLIALVIVYYKMIAERPQYILDIRASKASAQVDLQDLVQCPIEAIIECLKQIIADERHARTQIQSPR